LSDGKDNGPEDIFLEMIPYVKSKSTKDKLKAKLTPEQVEDMKSFVEYNID